MNKKNLILSPGRKNASLVALILLCTIFAAVVGSLRDRLHIDEVWTFGLSNNNGAPFYYDYTYGVGDSYLQDRDDFDYHDEQEYQDYFYHWHTSDYYRNYLTVQENERFDFANVFSNQAADTHPPLYYCVIHAICSLFPDCFSIWLGLAPNLFFYAGSLFFLYLIARELMKSERLAVLAMLLWGLSRAGITEVLFIRMYMMESFLALCLTYAHIKLIRQFRWPLVLLISVIEIAGFLTHYYFYIFAFFLTFFTCLYLLLGRQVKRMFGYGFAALFAVCISIAFFPATIRHLLHGTWSTTTATGLHFQFLFVQDLCTLLNQIVSFYIGADVDFLLLLCIAAPLVILGSLFLQARYHRQSREKGKNGHIPQEVLLARVKKAIVTADLWVQTQFPAQTVIAAAAIASGSLIVRLEPDMGEYIIRYMFVVLPLFSAFFVLLLNSIIHRILKNAVLKEYAQLFLILSVAMLVLCSNVFQDQVLLKLRQDSVGISLENEKVIVANIQSYRDHSFSYFYLGAEAVYPIDELDSRLGDALSDLDADETVFCLFHEEFAAPEVIDYFLSEIPGIKYHYLMSSYYPLEIDSLYHVYMVKIDPQ